MNKLEVLLVDCGARVSGILREATSDGFLDVLVTTATNVGEALGRMPSAGPELLVLEHPKPDDVTKILEAVDSDGLPRWAVVLLGTNPLANWVETLPPEELSVSMIRRVFRSALEQHSLRREIARARGDLLAIGSRVSHDLRTEVASILTNTELLREILSKDKPPLTDLTEPIFSSVDALGKIIERLSFLAMASARGAAKKPVDMGHVVVRALQRMESEILRRKASIVQPDSWPAVSGEPAWIEKIWCDLLANALVHSSGPARIELGWQRKEEGHRFWVGDNGAGVSPEIRPQLFQPFHKMHRANGPRGLGLPMVQRLIELQGGSCGYENCKEGGATFFFTLPI